MTQEKPYRESIHNIGLIADTSYARFGASAAIRSRDEIEVTVLAVTGNQVRIGVDALQNIPVHREEVYQRIAEERDFT